MIMDSVVLFNFRGDRAIELSRAFDEDDFDVFDRVRRLNVMYAGMMQYDGDLNIPTHFLVPPHKLMAQWQNICAPVALKHWQFQKRKSMAM